MSEEKKLKVISTLKRLRRPCTTLDLAKNLGMSRKETNPLLYEFQKQGLIHKVQESNPPMWDLTTTGHHYGTRKGGGHRLSIGRGRGRGLLGLAAATSITPGDIDTSKSDEPSMEHLSQCVPSFQSETTHSLLVFKIYIILHTL